MASNEDAPEADHSIFKSRIEQRIDEILDLGTKDPVATKAKARRLLEWLKRQKTTGQAELDRHEIMREVQYLINILNKS